MKDCKYRAGLWRTWAKGPGSQESPPAAGSARERPYTSEVSVGWVGAPVRYVQRWTGEVMCLRGVCGQGGCSSHSYFTNQIADRTQAILSEICAAAPAALHISERTQFLLSEICAAAPRLCTSPPACGGRCKRNRKEDVQASLTSSFLFRLRREGDSNS